MSSIASHKYAGRFAVAAGAFVVFVRLARVLPGAVWDLLTEPQR